MCKLTYYEKLELLSSGLAFHRNNWNLFLFVKSNFSYRRRLFWWRFVSRGGDLGSRFLIERRKRSRFSSLSLYICHWSPLWHPFVTIYNNIVVKAWRRKEIKEKKNPWNFIRHRDTQCHFPTRCWWQMKRNIRELWDGSWLLRSQEILSKQTGFPLTSSSSQGT